MVNQNVYKFLIKIYTEMTFYKHLKQNQIFEMVKIIVVCGWVMPLLCAATTSKNKFKLILSLRTKASHAKIQF
jgi:hypothetical protein